MTAIEYLCDARQAIKRRLTDAEIVLASRNSDACFHAMPNGPLSKLSLNDRSDADALSEARKLYAEAIRASLKARDIPEVHRDGTKVGLDRHGDPIVYDPARNDPSMDRHIANLYESMTEGVACGR